MCVVCVKVYEERVRDQETGILFRQKRDDQGTWKVLHLRRCNSKIGRTENTASLKDRYQTLLLKRRRSEEGGWNACSAP